MVLYAWTLGIGTTWVEGTLDRPLFEKAADTKDNEYMMIVTPIGYPSKTQSKIDMKLRESVKGDERLPESELFYEHDFSTPLDHSEDCLDADHWAPSAANKQPWRIVKDDNDYHFFLEHTKGYSSGVEWDVQKIDMGIAICHFMYVKNGNLVIDEPEIETDEHTEYIATISREKIKGD